MASGRPVVVLPFVEGALDQLALALVPNAGVKCRIPVGFGQHFSERGHSFACSDIKCKISCIAIGVRLGERAMEKPRGIHWFGTLWT